MKTPILRLVCVILMFAFTAGCGEKISKSSQENAGSQLAASDLAQLMDFHAWKVSIPKTQQPIKAIRLVIFNTRDGTIVTKFSTGSNLHTDCDSFLLGIHVEQGKFTGHLLTRSSDGRGIGWPLDFTDALADSYPAWSVSGTLVWNGNRAELAKSTKSNIFDNVLAVELEK